MVDFSLKPHPTIPKPEGPLLVCIMDGWYVVKANHSVFCEFSHWTFGALLDRRACPSSQPFPLGSATGV